MISKTNRVFRLDRNHGDTITKNKKNFMYDALNDEWIETNTYVDKLMENYLNESEHSKVRASDLNSKGTVYVKNSDASVSFVNDVASKSYITDLNCSLQKEITTIKENVESLRRHKKVVVKSKNKIKITRRKTK